MLMAECLGLWDMTRLARIHVARYEDHITKLEEPLDLQRHLRQHAESSPPKWPESQHKFHGEPQRFEEVDPAP